MTQLAEQPTASAAAGVRAPARRPEGPIAAAIFAACCGVFAMGLASFINQALNPLQWVPIAGVTPIDQLHGGRKMALMWSNFAQMAGLLFVMVIVWLLVWVMLHEAFAHRRTVGRRWYVASLVLLVAGLVLSFPPFYQWVFREPVSAPLRLGSPFTWAGDRRPSVAGPLAVASCVSRGSPADHPQPARPQSEVSSS